MYQLPTIKQSILLLWLKIKKWSVGDHGGLQSFRSFLHFLDSLFRCVIEPSRFVSHCCRSIAMFPLCVLSVHSFAFTSGKIMSVFILHLICFSTVDCWLLLLLFLLLFHRPMYQIDTLNRCIGRWKTVVSMIIDSRDWIWLNRLLKLDVNITRWYTDN